MFNRFNTFDDKIDVSFSWLIIELFFIQKFVDNINKKIDNQIHDNNIFKENVEKTLKKNSQEPQNKNSIF